MSRVELLRERLIDKIFNISNEEFLTALDSLITATKNDLVLVDFNETQLEMIAKSKADIEAGRTITNEEMKKESAQWLKDQNPSK
ncbi:MAG: hypothetical protein NWQ55_08065 [Salibacteraceae bacterium]|jgi:predicted transcriptional regulator|nr:hypothetical protein [Salibacteraceae bacterium]MDP4687569.1 hypothetical protein [Salibacteraceae bacterium]MDP4762615.1 hypothetical protein [Salibacteraceae bacterium]MDP4935415.1 hypothetical protein [Salibacteraceae bacterium]MDP4965012.1 hypothetical protein [Salibacteraceae bacterium]